MMFKRRRFLVSVLLMVLLFSCTLEQKICQEEKNIKEVLTAYFDTKYQDKMNLVNSDFSFLICEDQEGSTFYQEEKKLRDIELENAKEHNLGYVKFEYTLDYENVKIDGDNADVELLESHKVNFALDPSEVSELLNFSHKFSLKKEKGVWKIAVDEYKDELSDFINNSDMTADEIIQLNKRKLTDHSLVDNSFVSPVLSRSGVWHSYNRSAAASYAYQWALSRNSNYGDFSSMGGDCTNFVSQVIHAGGAPMDSTGSYLWYYYSYSNRSPSWTGVSYLYDYLVGNSYTGPVGQLSSASAMAIGDIIQLRFNSSGSYQHSLAVYRISGSSIYICCHSTDRRNYPLSYYSYNAIRYIKITGYYD